MTERSARPRLISTGRGGVVCSYCRATPRMCLCWDSPAVMAAWAENLRQAASYVRHRRRWRLVLENGERCELDGRRAG